MTRIEKAQITKLSLYQSFISLVNEKGYDDVLIEDITDRAGVAKGTFYNHFESKMQLLSYTFNYLDESYPKALEIAKSKSDYYDMFETFIRESYKKIEKLGKELGRAICSNLVAQEGEASYFGADRALYTALEYLVSKGLEEGHLNKKYSCDFYVEKIMVTLLGTESAWFAFSKTQTLAEFATENVRILMRGFGVTPNQKNSNR